MDLNRARTSIESRADLSRFVYSLRESLRSDPESWENASLDRYLEALAAWIADMEGYFLNQGIAEPDEPSWRLVGEMLFAASMYE